MRVAEVLRLVERFLEVLRLEDLRLVERFLEVLRLEDLRLVERFLEVLRLEERRLETFLAERRLEDLRLETLRVALFRHLERRELRPLHAFIACFKEGREPSLCLFAFRHAINFLVQETILGDNLRFDERRLVDLRFEAILYLN